VVVAAAVGALVMHPEWIKVGSVRLELVPGSKEELLYQRIRLSLAPQLAALEGHYFWEVPLKKVFEATTGDRRVKSVSVFREFPSILRVVIEPHTPLLAYLGDDGRVYPVATDATLLPAIPSKDAPDLPLLRGEDLKNEISLREKALELWQAVPNDGAFAREQISEIAYTKKDGFKVYVGGPGVEVRMGDGEFEPKISRVTKVMSYLQSQSIKGRVIDARFNKKVVVRVRKR
jgi:cell division septal protein FtsQ